MQNKANVKMGKMAISTARTKAYANKQRTMNNERYSKQTQSKPISNAQTVQWCEKSHPTGLALAGGAEEGKKQSAKGKITEQNVKGSGFPRARE